MPEQTWQDVATVIVNSWPAGPGNRGWEREQVAGLVAELQERHLQPHMVIVGLRASLSSFVPSVGEVVRLYRESLPPMTASEIEEAWALQQERRREADRLAAAKNGRELGAG